MHSTEGAARPAVRRGLRMVEQIGGTGYPGASAGISLHSRSKPRNPGAMF